MSPGTAFSYTAAQARPGCTRPGVSFLPPRGVQPPAVPTRSNPHGVGIVDMAAIGWVAAVRCGPLRRGTRRPR
eukprot:5881091-Lingulodinium_polyedra.AAC.1